MAIKTFTTGEVLTASDTNTYLNNGGLVLITSGITVSSVGGTAATVSNGEVTVGTSNTSVTVSGAFSATYDNYRIIYDGGSHSTSAAINLQLGATTSGYHWAYIFNQYTASAVVGGASTVGINFDSVGRGATTGNSLSCDLYGPFLSKRTGAKYLGTDYSSAGFNVSGNAFLNDTTSYTAFTILTPTGSMTGGKIRVYGYRQP
jgi:hypothetical protein